MFEMGVERQRMKVEQARKYERETSTPTGRYLLRESVAQLAAWVREWSKNSKRSATHSPAALNILRRFSPEVAALIACQAVIDGISGVRSYHSICYAIGKRLEDEEKYALFAESDKGVWEAMMRTAKKEKSYAEFRRYVDEWREKCGVEGVAWTQKERLIAGQALVEGLEICTGLIDIILKTYNKRKKKIVQPSPETLEWMKTSCEYHEALFPYYLPTVIPPRPWSG